jgi:hypothetical protein
MNGRIYDPVIGRFLSADILVQAPANQQSYNRYSYVFNNPLSFTDPSGFAAKGPSEEDQKKQQAEAWKKLADKGIVGLKFNTKTGELTGIIVKQGAKLAQGLGAPSNTDRASDKSPESNGADGKIKSQDTVNAETSAARPGTSTNSGRSSGSSPASLGDADSGVAESYSPDHQVDGPCSTFRRATLFILSPTESGRDVMTQISSKLQEKESYLFDIDAWRASGKSVKDFLGDSLKGRSFFTVALLAHGDAKGICDRSLAVLFDARTDAGRSFLSFVRPYINSKADILQLTCYGEICDAQAQANANICGASYWVGSNGKIFPFTSSFVPSTNNIKDGYSVSWAPGHWRVYKPKP